jgi:hypothetical protein
LPTIAPPIQTGSYIEGTASIADRITGDLLFYTDGQTVWNAQNQPMPNGSELAGSTYLSSGPVLNIISLRSVTVRLDSKVLNIHWWTWY